jgi:SARP family transcriptional regulator, regulator of embCAB operon
MSAAFRVLGPLSVESNGVDRTPSAQKLRTVLAMLLMHPNTILGSDVITAEVWGSAPPASARNTLQSYIVHLRRCVAFEESTRIESDSYGYRLVVDESRVDLADFRSRLADAYEFRRRCESEAARDALRAALGLWRDQPLTNVPLGPVLQSSYSYLTELWLSATERRIAIDVELGGHHDVLGELTLLVGQHPLNENLSAQLMLALYRSGRRYAALRTYETLRQALVDELGLDPSPVLKRMQHAVLTCHPALERGTEGRLAIDVLAG